MESLDYKIMFMLSQPSVALGKLLEFLFLYSTFSKMNTLPTTWVYCELVNERMIGQTD